MALEPGFQSLQARQAAVDAIRENTSRPALCQLSFKSHGWGEFKYPDAAYFTCTFLERPWVSTGVSIDGDTLVPTRFPRITAGVFKWIQDTRDFYIGAWVFFVVDTQSPYIATTDPQPGYDLIHDFTFSGKALKDLPEHLLDKTL